MPRNTNDEQVLQALKANPGATAKQIAQASGVPQRQVTASVNRLENTGQVDRKVPETKPGEQYKGDTFTAK